MHHHTVADGNLGYAGADFGDDAARLVAGDFQVGRVAAVGFGGAIMARVAAAQAGCFHPDYDFARAGTGVGQSADFNLAASGENYASYFDSLR